VLPQFGHHDIETLMGYIVHNAERIRDVYNKTFGDIGEITVKPQIEMNTDTYRKRAVEKYLQGELDVNTLTTMLKTVDHDNKSHRQPIGHFLWLK